MPAPVPAPTPVPVPAPVVPLWPSLPDPVDPVGGVVVPAAAAAVLNWSMIVSGAVIAVSRFFTAASWALIVLSRDAESLESVSA